MERSIVEMGDDVREIRWGRFGDEINTGSGNRLIPPVVRSCLRNPE